MVIKIPQVSVKKNDRVSAGSSAEMKKPLPIEWRGNLDRGKQKMLFPQVSSSEISNTDQEKKDLVSAGKQLGEVMVVFLLSAD